jgi:hypothetical protein
MSAEYNRDKSHIRFGNNNGGPLEHPLPFNNRLPTENILYKPGPLNAPKKPMQTIGVHIRHMFKDNANIPRPNNILNNLTIVKNEYIPYFNMVKNVRYNIKGNINKVLYIYEQIIPFDVKNKLRDMIGQDKIEALKISYLPLYTKLKEVVKLLTAKDKNDYDVLYEYILNYTNIPQSPVFGGRRKSHTRSKHNRRYNQSKTKRNLRK